MPSNCSFLVDDAEAEEWAFPDKFDLIHGRALSGSFKDWPAFYSRSSRLYSPSINFTETHRTENVFDSLQPGGTLEMQEHRNKTMAHDKPLRPRIVTLNETVNKAADMFGKRLDTAHEHKAWMEAAGFVDVVDHKVPTPVHNWPKDSQQKEIGMYHLAHFSEALESYLLMLYINVLGMSADDVKVEISNIQKELMDKENHLYTDFHFISAKKPEA